MRALALALLVLAAPAAAQAVMPVVLARDDGSGEGPAYRFEPTELTLAPGAPFRVDNVGQDAHTFSHDAAERAFHTGAVAAGASADLAAPTQAGDYPFVCVFHGGMRGTLHVSAAEDPAPTPTPAEAPLPWALALAALAGGALLPRRRA